jgi:hypothetical protein
MSSTVESMADVLRSCSKTACRWPAAASLSYRYATRQVWLLDLAATRDPALYDLCPHHADTLVVPNGWERVDDRTVQEIMVEPSADDRAEEAARRRSITAAPRAAETVAPQRRELVGASSGGNRYANLVAQLPKLAAEAGVPGATYEPTSISAAPAQEQRPAPLTVAAEPPLPPAPAAEVDATPAAEVEAPPPPPANGPAVDVGRLAPPVPSRDLAPLPAGEPAWTEPALPSERPLPGQLAIPVDDLTGETSGVVLQFELAGSRRRNSRS